MVSSTGTVISLPTYTNHNTKSATSACLLKGKALVFSIFDSRGNKILCASPNTSRGSFLIIRNNLNSFPIVLFTTYYFYSFTS